VTDRAEALLLKSARELSLVLPNHLNARLSQRSLK
jgi:hypothetical protein